MNGGGLERIANDRVDDEVAARETPRNQVTGDAECSGRIARALELRNRVVGVAAQRALPFDEMNFVLVITIAVFAGLMAGLYPAWRIGRAAPASYLKAQ